MKEVRFKAAVDALGDPALTRIVLVSRPDGRAGRDSAHVRRVAELGLDNQRLAINGVFTPSLAAMSWPAPSRAGEAPDRDAGGTRSLPRDEVPLRAFDMVGLPALRALLSGVRRRRPHRRTQPAGSAAIDALIDELAAAEARPDHGHGQGGRRQDDRRCGPGPRLTHRGHSVHLTTTDPAAHLAGTLDGEVAGFG